MLQWIACLCVCVSVYVCVCVHVCVCVCVCVCVFVVMCVYQNEVERACVKSVDAPLKKDRKKLRVCECLTVRLRYKEELLEEQRLGRE